MTVTEALERRATGGEVRHSAQHGVILCCLVCGGKSGFWSGDGRGTPSPYFGPKVRTDKDLSTKINLERLHHCWGRHFLLCSGSDALAGRNRAGIMYHVPRLLPPDYFPRLLRYLDPRGELKGVILQVFGSPSVGAGPISCVNKANLGPYLLWQPVGRDLRNERRPFARFELHKGGWKCLTSIENTYLPKVLSICLASQEI